MEELVPKQVSKFFGSVRAVEPTDLTFGKGQLTAFLGPSGYAKTTLLRIVSGLEAPLTGQIRQSGADITDLPTHKRKFGMVLHLPKTDAGARANEHLDLVQLGGHGDRRIGALSGGQRQREAVARALEQKPDEFPLDKPMSAFDAKLREEMQVKLLFTLIRFL